MARRRKKVAVTVIGIVVLIMILLLTYPIYHSPDIINNNIARLSKVFTEHKSDVWAVRFSPDGNLLASGSVDSTVIIRNVHTSDVMKILHQPQGITGIDFSGDGNYIATSSYDGKIRVWNVAEGKLSKTFAGHEGTAWCVAFSPDGKSVASCGEDKLVKIWDISTGNILRELKGHTLNIWAIKFSPDGKRLASGSFDRTVKLWDVSTGALLNNLNEHTEAVVDLAFSHDGKALATTSDDKTIKLWNAQSATLLKTFKVAEHVQAVAFSPDNKRLLTGGRDKDQIGEFVQNFTGNSKYFKGVSARLWDIATGQILQTFSQHENDVNDVAISPDGHWFATASSDATVELWRIEK